MSGSTCEVPDAGDQKMRSVETSSAMAEGNPLAGVPYDGKIAFAMKDRSRVTSGFGTLGEATITRTGDGGGVVDVYGKPFKGFKV